ncbi:glycoside hydrolase superfamily [Boletus edulis BED1]|uniref:chitinase n=1 Tax=Boletus edulis BED1 TaxID=1328754 RepID=A0AAD4BPW1_BOLED|nr:glycoside hydrolase superfamily [Boletus edulis BED1]
MAMFDHVNAWKCIKDGHSSLPRFQAASLNSFEVYSRLCLCSAGSCPISFLALPKMVSQITPVIRLCLCLCFVASAMAFDMSRNTNLAVYWGQNSYGAVNLGNKAVWQQPIEHYCADNTIDTIPVAFLNEFYSTGNLPSINLANTCSTVDDPLFPGTNLPKCTFLAAGIETCQKAGKIITLSLGGAAGSAGFASDSEGAAYAQVIWNVFLGGSSNTRPFGTAVLDGIDMDIEGGSQAGYAAFLTALRKLMNGGNKRYYITAAPQCPFPDAYIGTTLNKFAFDAVYVQFYNNYCGVNNFANTNAWDFGMWDQWAKTVSPNKNVKVYIGAPASSSAASNGYVSASTLAGIISRTKSQYSSFGGVMLWDASQAYANGRYDQAVKAALTGSSGAPPSSPTSSSPSLTSSSPSPSTTKGAGCAGVSAWESTLIYLGDDQVTSNNQLWTAKWWTEGATPGGSEGVWTLVGPC